jgi:hypothetical protein
LRSRNAQLAAVAVVAIDTLTWPEDANSMRDETYFPMQSTRGWSVAGAGNNPYNSTYRRPAVRPRSLIPRISNGGAGTIKDSFPLRAPSVSRWTWKAHAAPPRIASTFTLI